MSPDPADRPEAFRPPDPRTIEMARMTAAVPAVFLILNGLLGLVIAGLLSVPLVFDPDWLLNTLKEAVAQQPAGPERQENEKKLADLEAQLNQNRDSYVLQNAIVLSIAALFNLAAIIGGFCMRRLSGYPLCMIGAIASLIPLATGCCVTGIPFGIWALVVLVRPEIKAAFQARRHAPPSDPDAQYMR